ncbi:MAG: hypothetical protein E6I75_23810 [Chloroflexi bacterium]|nr:MAG: hypothetical protein E6I75_23810 [Chloroflexota bacterium]
MDHFGAAKRLQGIAFGLDHRLAQQRRCQAAVLVRVGPAARHGHHVARPADNHQPSVSQGPRSTYEVVNRVDVAARERAAHVLRQQSGLVGQIEHDAVVQAAAHGAGGIQRRSRHTEHRQAGVGCRQPAAQRV